MRVSERTACIVPLTYTAAISLTFFAVFGITTWTIWLAGGGGT